jgi:dTDP-4-dehydrorhamnose 3,5-epimerase
VSAASPREAHATLEISPTAIPDVKIIRPAKHSDPRGFFSETYHKQQWADAGIDFEFVQDNHSLSRRKGTVRGLHYQIPPFAQDKLVRVTRGAVFDVAVDLRRTSPTFGRHAAVILSAEAWNQLLIPCGFAHGYGTLEDDTEVLYKVTNYYSREHERGLYWNDPALAIPWPISDAEALLSDKDRQLPRFSELRDLFD